MTENRGPITTEHAILMAGGSMQVLDEDPETERDYPIIKRIQHRQKFGFTVYQRRVIVVDDWTEVPAA